MLTPWYPGDVPPVYIGVYQVEPPSWDRVMYAHWSPRGWGWWADTPATAALHRNHVATSRGRWRGLSQCTTAG